MTDFSEEIHELEHVLSESTRPRRPRPLTNFGVCSRVPMFVKGWSDDEDHKCGSCSMRVPAEGDEALCTHVVGTISLSKGTCLLWARGKAAERSDPISPKVSRETAGYIETDAKVQCGTCRYSDDGYCVPWGGTVSRGDCCIIYERDSKKD